MTDPFTTARNDIAGLPGHGMSADVQVAEQRVGEEVLLQKLRMIVSHATAGSMQYTGQSTNEISCQITRIRNTIYQAGKDATPKPADPTSVAGERMREALERIAALEITPIAHEHAAARNGKALLIAKNIARVHATNAPDAAKREGGE